NWALGVVSSVTVDKRDHVWIFQRPETVPENLRSRSAPPVLEYDASGTFLNAWGGPGAGHDWPVTEHGITVDVDKNTVWLGGSGVSDDFLLKYDLKGNFVKEFFAKGISKGNADTSALNRPSDAFVYAKTNEVFISDGYGNRRVIVLDANTGAFKRMWGAFANEPLDVVPAGRGAAPPPRDLEGPGPQQWGIVHAVRIANDGLVFVADRGNRRFQGFAL